MQGLNLGARSLVCIENLNFSVINVVKRSYEVDMKMKNQVDYYSYKLKTDYKNITEASINYLSDENIVFHLTKNVSAKILENKICIDGVDYGLFKSHDGFFLNGNRDISEVKEYKLINNRPGIVPPELQVLADGKEIFYLNIKLKRKDVIIKND